MRINAQVTVITENIQNFYKYLYLIFSGNACFIDGVKPYPGDCSRFLSCSNNNTNVLKCAAGNCFEGTLSTCVTNNCTNICTS